MTELLYRSPDSAAEVWIGDCLDPESVAAVMGERKADALIVDAPYSERTHGRNESTSDALALAVAAGRATLTTGRIVFRPWAPDDVSAFCGLWLPMCRGWSVSITDHVLAPAWESSFATDGRCGFAPLPFVERGSRIRVCGDGPSCWTCWTVVARPRSRLMAHWGTLPGAYLLGRETKDVVGGKPLAGMLAIVGDYSRHGDLVVDPCCGAGTTGVAARTLGRRFIGIDSNREHAEIAVRRISEAREQVVMPGTEPEAHQTTMFPAVCGAKGE